MCSDTRSEGSGRSDGYVKWSVKEVGEWCAEKLQLDGEDLVKLQECIEEQGIDGDILDELSLQDCKMITGGNVGRAVRLKVELNRLREKKHNQEQEIVQALQQLQSTVSDKLQDFQTQYTRLRLDVLEVVKKSTQAAGGHSLPQTQSQTQLLHHNSQQPQHDYFEGHRLPTPGSPGNTTFRQSVSRSTSGALPTPSVLPTAANPPTPQPPTTAGSEPLKHLRASKEDSCERILKNAMKRHNLNEQDWKQYVLVICYGDQERILELDEKPVMIFKTLKQQGLHPAIMLRQRGDFEEVGGELTPGGRL
ncbi:LAFE_0G01332g1_1 [Lachancea fermentati]|uniref:LAFE_0G01332g1_1 n=1 Tax=Lachancea fermentati TaxID=4955 RepID=A0A1G4MGI2_LACFM|nr:LAFE_0G01332g1_1 [Lachancea fermentati]